MKKMLRVMVLLVTLLGAGQANAGIPVIDAAANGLAAAGNAVMGAIQGIQAGIQAATEEMNVWLQEQAWFQQAQDMMNTLDKLQTQIDDVKGMTDFSKLLNTAEDKAAWGYLPDDYNDVVTDGIGTSADIIDAIKDEVVTSSEMLESNAKQAAINRALGDLAYKQASGRFDRLQGLMDEIENAELPKEKMDLQSRMVAEQMMLQNEQIKLASLQILTKAQEQLDEQRKKEQVVKKLSTSFTDFGL